MGRGHRSAVHCGKMDGVIDELASKVIDCGSSVCTSCVVLLMPVRDSRCCFDLAIRWLFVGFVVTLSFKCILALFANASIRTYIMYVHGRI